MTYTEFLEETIVLKHFHPELRMGQALMNALYGADKALYEAIQPTDVNPFYIEARVPDFLTEVEKRWTKQ